MSFVVRVGSDPERFIPRLRTIVASIDPSALVQDAITLAEVPDPNRRVLELATWLVAALALIAVVLAASCLYALMSFTVAERTRESAIRAALGARPASIVRGIARRAFVQLSLGVVIGSAMSALVLSLVANHDGGTFRADDWPLVVGALALLIVVVGMLACVRPTLRVLRIQPQEALKG